MVLIINADDCGINKIVNDHIEQCILEGKISSTTVMANMLDFEGALGLYVKYNDRISFGIHLNLTEGSPLLSQPALVESGHYVIKDGKALFNMKDKKRRYLNSEQRLYIYEELKAQFDKLINAGINISHIDSHHHIHTDINILPIVIRLAKEYNITKIRGLRNYMPFSISYLLRKLWYMLVKVLYPSVKQTDYLTSYIDYTKNPGILKASNSVTLELECHPGHPKYLEEEMLLRKWNLDNENIILKSYNTAEL